MAKTFRLQWTDDQIAWADYLNKRKLPPVTKPSNRLGWAIDTKQQLLAAKAANRLLRKDKFFPKRERRNPKDCVMPPECITKGGLRLDIYGRA
jgi:hypothetical protein